MVEDIPMVIDGNNYILRVYKDDNGKVIEGTLCVPCGDLLLILRRE